jgi:tRNA(fMet)-specific endonuclease VapC
MTEFLLDTDTASRIISGQRRTLRALSRSGATSIGVSAVTRSELLFGAHLRHSAAGLMASVRRFLRNVDNFAWDDNAAEHHALVRAEAYRLGRHAGPYDIMIAAHALALGRTLVTNDQAIHGLGIRGLAIVDWSR